MPFLSDSSLWKVQSHEMLSAESGRSHTQVAFGAGGCGNFLKLRLGSKKKKKKI